MRVAMRRRSAAIVAGLALLAAGCGNSAEDQVNDTIDAAESQAAEALSEAGDLADDIQASAEAAVDEALSEAGG